MELALVEEVTEPVIAPTMKPLRLSAIGHRIVRYEGMFWRKALCCFRNPCQVSRVRRLEKAPGVLGFTTGAVIFDGK
jgi:hypothetical protein